MRRCAWSRNVKNKEATEGGGCTGQLRNHALFKKDTKRRNLSVSILNKIMDFLNQMRWSRVIWTIFLLSINHFAFDKNRRLSSSGFERILTYLLSYLLTHILRPRSRDPLEHLTGFRLVKKFPAFCGSRRFITAFTSDRHLSLSWVTWIQSIPPNPTSWRSFLLHSSHLHLCLPLKLIYTLLIL